jgi:hypothetical protein
VTVASGATCVLTAATTVTHDLVVAAGGTLIDPAVTIGHDLVANSPAGIVISGDSIGHDLRIRGVSGSAGSAGNDVCDTVVRHDLVIDDGLASAAPLSVGGCAAGGNTVGHDLVVSENANAITVTGNTIGHDLLVTENTGAVSVSGNSVGHDVRIDGSGTSDFSGTVPPAQPSQRPPKAKLPKPHGRKLKPKK